MRRTKEEAEKTRRQILEAAIDVFSEKPYSKVSIAEIAEKVGMTKGAVYWHFKSKNELFIKLAEYLHSESAGIFVPKGVEITSLEDIKKYYKLFIQNPASQELHVKVRRMVLRMNEWPDEVYAALCDLRKEALNREKRFVAEVLEKEKRTGKVKEEFDCEAVSEAIVAVFSGLGNLRFMEMLEKDFFKHIDFLFNAIDNELTAGNVPQNAKNNK